jgi:ankyrin repeat protein
MRTSLFLLVACGLASWFGPVLAGPPQADEDPRRYREQLESLQKQTLLDAPKEELQLAVQEAAFRGYRDVAEKLLGRGAQEDLFVAAGLGKADRVTALLKVEPTLTGAAGWGGNTALHFAARNNHVTVAKELLAQGADIEVNDEAGMTPLGLAAEQGHREVVQLLLAHKADVSAHDRSGRTALHRAARHGRVAVAALLLAHGANIDVMDERRWRPLDEAAHSGQKRMVRLLLTHGAKVSDTSPLAVAVNGRIEIDAPLQDPPDVFGVAALLLAHGAEPNEPIGLDESLLRVALLHQKPKVGRLLVAHGAKVTLGDAALLGMTDEVRSILKEHYDQATLPVVEESLFFAAQRDHATIVKLLLDHVAYDGRTVDVDQVLREAVLHGSGHVVKMMAHRGVDLTQTDGDDRTLLHNAVDAGQTQMVRQLLAAGLDVNACDRDGNTALHVAIAFMNAKMPPVWVDFDSARNRQDETPSNASQAAAPSYNMDVLTLLLGAGADVNARNNAGETPLHFAAQGGLAKVMQFLLDHKADGKAHAANGRTPLHVAVEYGRKEATRFLLEAGVDVNAKDRHGRNPFHIMVDLQKSRDVFRGGGLIGMEVFFPAPPSDFVAVAELLLAYDANPNATDNFGQPPLAYFTPYSDRGVAEQLMKVKADGTIFVAVALNDLHRVRALLEAHPELVDARDGTYRTPLHEAVRLGYRVIVDELLSHKADVWARDARARTARDIALATGNEELVGLFPDFTLRQQIGSKPRSRD